MAIKDWKIISPWRDYYPSITFGRVGDRYSFVMVWKTGLPLKEMKRRGLNGTYIFKARIGKTRGYAKKYFKTKSAALKFAKEYMKKH